MFDFGIFCNLLRLMGIYLVQGSPSGYLKIFVLFSFIPFLFYTFSLSLWGPFSSGAPGHCPPMPPSRCATACTPLKILTAFSNSNSRTTFLLRQTPCYFALNYYAEKRREACESPRFIESKESYPTHPPVSFDILHPNVG